MKFNQPNNLYFCNELNWCFGWREVVHPPHPKWSQVMWPSTRSADLHTWWLVHSFLPPPWQWSCCPVHLQTQWAGWSIPCLQLLLLHTSAWLPPSSPCWCSPGSCWTAPGPPGRHDRGNEERLYEHASKAQGERYLRPLLRLQVEGVSNQSPLGSLHAPLQELLVDVFLHVGAWASAAALALVEEQGKVGLLHRVLHWEQQTRQNRTWGWGRDARLLSPTTTTTQPHTVGVRQDDVRALSSQLQSDFLQVTATWCLLNQVTHLAVDEETSVTMLISLSQHLETGLSADRSDLKTNVPAEQRRNVPPLWIRWTPLYRHPCAWRLQPQPWVPFQPRYSQPLLGNPPERESREIFREIQHIWVNIFSCAGQTGLYVEDYWE